MRFLFVLTTLAFACSQKPADGPAYFSPPPLADTTAARGALGPKIASAMHAVYKSQHAAPAVSLKSDGSELVLEELEAKVSIEGPLAHTELHFTFHNPEARVREGKFSLVLPSDAAVSRLSMLVHGQWREARVVSREQGREVFEKLLHRGIDPALLEQDVGNTFSARVFPIFADEHKQIVVGFDHRVSESQPYVLPLSGIAAQRVHVAIDHDGARKEIDREGGGEDLVIAARAGSLALAKDGAFVARVETPPSSIAASFDRTAIFVDTSASRAPVLARQADVLRALLRSLPPDSNVLVAAYDHGVTELYRGVASGALPSAGAMLSHGALGASDLGAALDHAARAGFERVLLVGDGVPTLGEREPAKLAALIASKVARVDAVVVGNTVERSTLEPIVRAGREPGAIVDARDATRAIRQLSSAVAKEQPIRVAGALASWPATTRGTAPGEPIWVYGRRSGNGPLSIKIGDREVVLIPAVGKGDVGRAVAKAEVAALSESLARAVPTERPAIAERVEKLALEHFLVSPMTSLIVLESDADEQRYLGSTRAHAPTIDPGSTKQGITITRDYIQNIPTGRTFQGVLGKAAGSQQDSYGISFSGSTSSSENIYIVDSAPLVDISSTNVVRSTTYTLPTGPTSPMLRSDITSADALDLVADRLNGSAFAMYALPPPTRVPRSTPYVYEPTYAAPYEGRFAAIVDERATGSLDTALALANEWQLEDPGDVAATIALGEALEARGSSVLAARAYASIIDLYPSRPELLRTAAERLDRVATAYAPAGAFAVDAYRRALKERPDHVTTYRLLAWSLVRRRMFDEALDVLGAGLVRTTHPGAIRILSEEAGLVGAAIVAQMPHRRAEITSRMRHGIADRPSTRFVLSWETDANDVDLVVRDRFGGRASIKDGTLPGTGGSLGVDVRTGYGPELFVAAPSGFPYKLGVHYARKGPMGLGLGTVHVIHHDGRGNLVVEDRPFVAQNDNALVELGEVRAPR